MPTRGFFEWLTPIARGVDAHPWLAEAIAEVRSETDGLDSTWSLLHTDPTPEAFLHDPVTGTTGLIDWTGARRGPVMYDLASAVMYVGGSRCSGALRSSYHAAMTLPAAEIEQLDAYRRFRWIVQAAYFAQRLAWGDLTGVTDQADNWQGFRRAAAGSVELGVRTGAAP